MDNHCLGAIKYRNDLLSSEIIQESTKEEKLMKVSKRISSSPYKRLKQVQENESFVESKSLKSDLVCKAIRVSVIISPIKRVRNIVKNRNVEKEDSSCNLESKRNKEFDSSSVKSSQMYSQINIYPNFDDNVRGDYANLEYSASSSSSDRKSTCEQIFTLDSSEDVNASKDNMTSGLSLSSVNMLPDYQINTLDSNDDVNASRNNTTSGPYLSPISIFPHKQTTILDSSKVVIASRDNMISGSSLSSISMLPDEQVINLKSSDDQNASNDYLAIKSLTSADASLSSDCLSAKESSMNLDQEFPYECVHCDRRFSEAHNLFFHSKKHGRFFICKRCDRQFYCGSAFIHHIERHTILGGIPFDCSICNQGFSTRYYLRQHRKANHVNFRDLE
ncbi:unnamed protein product [Larinioides sclopetarius]|uniref:C2H2-type domain-containing protein n=1 Tax=Larinioides sclopetarius TaxID=280406 RepID=A0AAV2ACD0_9ARAC